MVHVLEKDSVWPAAAFYPIGAFRFNEPRGHSAEPANPIRGGGIFGRRDGRRVRADFSRRVHL
jgi:hypothetical protein